MEKLEIENLSQISAKFAVSIYAPTHRRVPENMRDPILVENLVTEATSLIEHHENSPEKNAALDNLRAAYASVKWADTKDGLAIFATESEFRTADLTHQPRASVSLGHEYAIAELVRGNSLEHRFYLLVLSESPTRLFVGNREKLQELAGVFPAEHNGRGGSQGLPTGYGQMTSVVRDEEHRKFFREILGGLNEYMQPEPLPLIVMGIEKYLAFWAEIAPEYQPDAIIEGSYDFLTDHELLERALPAIDEYLSSTMQKRLGLLDRALSEKKYSYGLDDNLKMAQEGRVETLVIDADLTGNAGAEALVRQVFLTEGDVFFFDSSAMGDHAPAAAKLRY